MGELWFAECRVVLTPSRMSAIRMCPKDLAQWNDICPPEHLRFSMPQPCIPVRLDAFVNATRARARVGVVRHQASDSGRRLAAETGGCSQKRLRLTYVAPYNPPMAHTFGPKPTSPAKLKRPAHRPTKFTPNLGDQICELVAVGWFMKDAARHFGIAPETVCRWVVKHEDFRRAYEDARRQRTEIWAEECIEIADDATGDYTTDEHGNHVFNAENVHRARLRIDARRWQMVRLDPQLWGKRQQIEIKHDWSNLTEEERVRRALQLLGIVREVPAI